MEHYPGSSYGSVKRFSRTGEFRPPRKGEWYLSGAIPGAWQAPNDLTTAYHILREVKVTVTTVERVEFV